MPICILFFIFILALPGYPGEPNIPEILPPTVTLLIDLPEEVAVTSIEAMKQEMSALVAPSGLRLAWRLLREVAQSDSFQELMVVHFRGRCAVDGIDLQFSREPGPLAWTHSSDGHILPFSEVDCDRLRQSVRTALYGDDYDRADLLYGRALARVLAHEFYHVLTNSGSHPVEGVAQEALSGYELIQDGLAFQDSELELLSSGRVGSP